MDKILVAVCHYQGASIFGRYGNTYMYDIALPLEKVPKSMQESVKYRNGESFLEFSRDGVPGRATSDTLPGYVCDGGWNWRLAWLVLTDEGFVFKPFDLGELMKKLEGLQALSDHAKQLMED